MQILAYPRVDTVNAGKKNLTGLVSELVEAECGQVREYRVVGAANKQEFTLSCRLILHAFH